MMRRIGQADNGMILFEMTKMEAHMFGRLALVMGEGNTQWEYKGQMVYLNDYSGVFGAIVAFAEAKYQINEIRQLADEFERALFREEP
jgi:hypothetical protein